MPDSDWFAEHARGGYVLGDPNMSEPMESRIQPGYECALNRYDSGSVWLFMRRTGENLWRPERVATEADVEAFRRAGKILENPGKGNT